MEKKSISEIISIVLKALALAMGVAVVVLVKLGSIEMETAISMLGMDLAFAGAALLSNKWYVCNI